MGRRRSIVRELLETAVLTIAIFLVVRIALQNFKVEGESMLPNLHNGEYILVIIARKDVQCHGLLASLPHATQRLGGTLGLLH